jgi:predicted CXXCH cytochrome family protein
MSPAMRRRFFLPGAAIVLAVAGCDRASETPAAEDRAASEPGQTADAGAPPPVDFPSPRALAKSSQCADCHADVTEKWRPSHHGLAHRDTGTEVEAEAFADRQVEAGAARWSFTGGAEHPRVSWSDAEDESAEPIEKETPMAIGLTPLVQYLIRTDDGRYQVPDMAWDPEKKDWFSIYGDEDRRPHEWGHWTQRGMNWNSQCAYCHFTGFEKNYDAERDQYDSHWVEQGVGCAQCHGPSEPNHGQHDCVIDPEKNYTPEQWMHSCATCHARREEFDEQFTIGDSFYDHYSLALGSQPGLYYPDGQQLEEVYKFASLMMSKMGHAGITCLDCHDPHSNEPIGGEAAVQTNALCLTCHAGGDRGATVIQPDAHTFHEAGTPGSRCVDCHMPKRDYMQRDPRSDHRFPIPDPRMTKELGTPNACNDCHGDQGLDWQIEWTDKWYGEKMERPERQRTLAIHAAREGRPGALDKLLEAYESEEIDAWRATLLRLMDPWAADRRVARLADDAAGDGGPLARAAAARLAGSRGDFNPTVETSLADPLKAVRLEAGWAAFDQLPDGHPIFEELEAVSRHQSDQPGGAMRMARLAMRRNDLREAEKWFGRAIEWDRTSPSPRRDFAVFLSGIGRTSESVKWLDEAAALAPENPEIPYLAALAYAELGEPGKAEERLRAALEINPRFARAHYNLGLLEAGQGRVREAIASLLRAEAADPTSPDAPYARATLHLRAGQIDQALEAAREAVGREPNHGPARQLLRELGGE